MKRVLIIGVNKNESALFNLLYTSDQFKIIAAIAQNKQENVCKVERTYNIPVDTEWQNWINEDIDIIIETTGDSHLLALLSNERQKQTLIIHEPLTRIIIELLEEKMTQTINNKLTQVIHLKEENTDLKKIKTMLKTIRSEEHTSELQSRLDIVCRLLLDK